MWQILRETSRIVIMSNMMEERVKSNSVHFSERAPKVVYAKDVNPKLAHVE